ncbi:timeless-domain-containing protein [Dentipellis sp. KUC8613]|nr:timeless-domain-containing protein [Dentipellis sp. KUC8613]
MVEDEVISLTSGESDREPEYVDRRTILEPPIRNVVEALGGYEGKVYRMGDEAYGCLKDLKKYWRKDDTDDERTVARIFWATRVLTNDLVPILLETAGKGHVEDKRAIACADLITAMTWPIDLAEELKELDEEMDRGTDYTTLLQSHLYYKAALLRPGVMQALFNIMLPCLAKDPKERKDRDVQIINVVLYLVRNLAFIKDLSSNVHLSSDQASFSALQSQYIKTLQETNFLDLLLTIASNAATDTMFNGWNTLVLEIFYLLFRGVKPSTLQNTRTLHQLLAIEDGRRRDFARYAPSRHSRFGTTISVKLNPKKIKDPYKDDSKGDNPAPAPAPAASSSSSSSQAFVLHRQQALNQEPGTILDLLKRQKGQKGKKVDELGREDNLSTDARTVLQGVARGFIESCFNPFLASLLKDIKSERPKITEKDNLRLLFITKWFLEFFLAVRSKQKEAGVAPGIDGAPWSFGLIGTVVERSWIIWVLKRMNGAMEEKPKLWTEWQAGIECLTQLLALIEVMGSSRPLSADGDGTELHEAAELVQQQLIYNGQVVDAALDGLRVYKEGTQSLAFLHASVHLAYNLFKMLERWGKAKGEAYVRKRAKPRKKRKSKAAAVGEHEDTGESEEEKEREEQEAVIEETMFTFDAFLMKFANPDIAHTLLTYLGRYQEFTSPECMKRVVGLMHRQAVRAKAEGLYFQVSTLDLFKSILANQKTLPKDQTSKDLLALITYLLRQFFKAVEADSFVLIEAFFPKNRGQWKKLSSWEPEAKDAGSGKAAADDARFPPDVQVKKGYSWSEQLGIAVAALRDGGKGDLVEWTKDILKIVIRQRMRVIEETDGARGKDSENQDANEADLDDEELRAALLAKGPSNEALAKITDYPIPYISDAQADAATKNPQLKLMFRLVRFFVQDDDAEELEWYVPAGVLVSDLQRSLHVIEQFEREPLDLGGKRAAQLLSKKAKRRRRRRADSGSEAEGAESDDEPRKKRERKKKEKEVYKSAQFIEDSDEEFGEDLDAFFAREKALREKMAIAAVDSALGIGTMRTTGTKKRRRRDGKAVASKKRKKAAADSDGDSDSDVALVSPATAAGRARGGSDEDSDDASDPFAGSRTPGTATTTPALDQDEHDASPAAAPKRPRPRPRPRPVFRKGGAGSGDPGPGGRSPASAANAGETGELASGAAGARIGSAGAERASPDRGADVDNVADVDGAAGSEGESDTGLGSRTARPTRRPRPTMILSDED